MDNNESVKSWLLMVEAHGLQTNGSPVLPRLRVIHC